MSTYVKVKAVRYKPTENDLKRLGLTKPGDLWDLEDKMPEIFGYSVRHEAEKAGKPYFALDSGYNDIQGKCNYYIDYVLEYEYDAGCGDFGRSRKLYPQEAVKYGKIFEQVLGECGPQLENLKLVEFCFYNGCDAPDYFDETDDPFFKGV